MKQRPKKHTCTLLAVIFSTLGACSKAQVESCETDTGLHKAVATRYYCWESACGWYSYDGDAEAYQEKFDSCVETRTDPQTFGQALRVPKDNCLLEQCVAVEGTYTAEGCGTITDECRESTMEMWEMEDTQSAE